MAALRNLNHRFDYVAHPEWVVLGLGGTFNLPPDHDVALPILWRFSDDTRWTAGPIRNQRQGDIIYAYPIAQMVSRLNRDSVEFHNPWVRGNAAWQPIVGMGARYVTPPPPRWDPEEDLEVDEDEDEEEDEEDLTDDELMAVAAVGEVGPLGNVLTMAMINEARVRLGMNPHPLPAPPAEPVPAPVPPVDQMGPVFTGTVSTGTPAPATFINPGPAKLWCITFNGVPMGNLEEFTAAAEPLLDNPKGSAVVQAWTAQWNEEPDKVMDPLMELEPILTACVGFTPIPQSPGVQVIQLPSAQEVREQPVGALIVRAAAGALLSGGMSDHFSFNEGGALVINAENPPTLVQGYNMMARIFSTEETGERLKNFSRWAQGALIAELQRFFGADFDMDLLCESTNRSYNTLNAVLNTHLRWPVGRRREGLSWTHHKEVEFSTLTDEQKEWVLDQSVHFHFTVGDQRKVQSYVRTYGNEGLIADMPETPGDMLQRVEIRAVNQNFLFLMQQRWFSYRGPFAHIPNGAGQILNVDTRQFLDREGNPSTPEEWVPPGVEVPYLRGNALINAQGIETARATGELPDTAHHGRTQHAGLPTGPPLDVTEIMEAMHEADEDLAIALGDPVPVAEEETLSDTIADPPAVITPTPEPVTVLPATRGAPRVITPHIGQNATDYIFTYPDFYNEGGARFLMQMEGYPQQIPDELIPLLDAARQEEFENQNGNRPRTQVAFRAFLEASNDALIPF